MSSKGKPPAEEEIQAARQFRDLTGLAWEALDGATGGSGQPDFSVLQPPSGCLRVVSRARRVGTLEVTRAAHQPTRRLQGALRKQANAGRHDLVRTSHIWHVQVESSAGDTTLGAEIQSIVDHLEQTGVERATRWDATGQLLDLAARRINSIYRGPMSTSPQADIVVVGLGGSTSRDALADVAEVEVANNRKKLESDGELLTHLWVWLEFDAPDAPDAMAHSIAWGVPGRMPRDPVLVTECVVWLAVPDQRWAIRWRTLDGWTVVRPPGPDQPHR